MGVSPSGSGCQPTASAAKTSSLSGIPNAAHALRLAKIFPGDDLRLCEEVHFERGRAGVELVLRRAAISGTVVVSPKGDLPDHFADILDAGGDLLECVALDAASFGKLKNHWMRCRYV